MRIPILYDDWYVNEFTRFSVYDTETYKVDVVSYDKLLSVFPDATSSKGIERYREALSSWARDIFMDKFVKLTDGIYCIRHERFMYFTKNNKFYRVYITRSIDEDEQVIPILMENKISFFISLESSEYGLFLSDCWGSVESVSTASIKRMALLGKDFDEIEFELNRSAIESNPTQGTDFGHYDVNTLWRLASMNDCKHTISTNPKVMLLKSTALHVVRNCYLQVENTVYYLRSEGYTTAIFNILQTDSKGNLISPYLIAHKLPYKDITEIVQKVALGISEDEILQDVDLDVIEDCVNIRIPNLVYEVE